MNEHKKSGFWDRAIQNLRHVWTKMGSPDDFFSNAAFSPDLSDSDRRRLINQMQACLEARGGEVSARSRAAALGHAYLALNETGRKRFLSVLAREFRPNTRAIDAAIMTLQRASDPVARMTAERTLKKSLDAPRTRLLTQFNALPEGVKFLVDMRAELMPWVPQDKALTEIEADLKTLLTSWFDVGFLELKQITWTASASLLEKLFTYEAVHEIKSWDDLKNRLDSDRRCFAFFHPRMPEQPLIFVWVALVEGMATNIQELLDEGAPIQETDQADTAIFYSISNTQTGLTGINFGNFLIKRVVDNLRREFKGLKTFATLSPIPGFMTWVRENLNDELLLFLTLEQKENLKVLASKGTPKDSLIHLLGATQWPNNPLAKDVLEPVLVRLVAHYLTKERRPGGTVVDSVAHFHLNNGARIEQINWAADMSTRGVEHSAGIMINYRYLLDDIDSNHELYRSGQKITLSPAVRNLL